MHLTDNANESRRSGRSPPASSIPAGRVSHRVRLEQEHRARRRRAAHQLRPLGRRRVSGPRRRRRRDGHRRSTPEVSRTRSKTCPTAARWRRPASATRSSPTARTRAGWVPTSSVYDATWTNAGLQRRGVQHRRPDRLRLREQSGRRGQLHRRDRHDGAQHDAVAVRAHSVRPGVARGHRPADAPDAVRRRLRRLHQRRVGSPRPTRPKSLQWNFARHRAPRRRAGRAVLRLRRQLRSFRSWSSARTCWRSTPSTSPADRTC